MLRRILIVGGACLGMALMVSPALGQRNVPKKAGKYQATLVQGVAVCTASNTTAPGILASPACSPVVPSDAGCVFEDNVGGGQVKSKAKDDVAVQAKLKGIDAACEGESLCAVASITSSYDSCANTQTCRTTSVDLALGASCCTVTDGKCQVKTSINVALPGALVPGQRTEFQLGEVGMLRTGATGLTTITFDGANANGQPLSPSTRRKAAAFRAGMLLP